MMQVIAYLHFTDNCEEALNFYKKTLDGTILQLSRTEAGPMRVAKKDIGKIIHARLKVGDSVIYFSDTFNERKAIMGDNIQLSLQLTDPAAMEKYFAGLSAGGTVTRPIEETFWGSKFGMLTDKYGVNWMLNCENK